MRARVDGLAILTGLAAFLLVGAVVTELVAPRIEFSLFVGVPVGLVAGVAPATIVFARLEDPVPERRRPALAVAGFGAAFVVALLFVFVGLRLRNSVAIPAAVVVGAIAAVATYLWSNRRGGHGGG